MSETTIDRLRARTVTPHSLRRRAVAAAAAFFVVTATGAVVRLTASGLGCSHWPKCGSAPYPQKGAHAFIEFSNRVVAIVAISLALWAWLGARRLPSLPRWAARLGLGVVIGGLLQIPLGGLVVVFGLQPGLVMAHFLVGLLVLGGAVTFAIEAWRVERAEEPAPAPRDLQRVGLGLAAACLVLVVTGAFASAAGPHSGGSHIHRLGTVLTSVRVHAGATAAFGLCFVFLLGWLAANRRRHELLFRAGLVLLAVVAVQAGIGEIQYRTRLPWWLVVIHVAFAALVWAGTVALVSLLWRLPRGLARAGDT